MGSNRKLAVPLWITSLSLALSACATTQAPPPPAPPPPTTACNMSPQNHVIEIGSQVSCKLVVLKCNKNGDGNTIIWRATDATRKIRVTFEDPNVFPSLSCPGTQNTCQSGALSPSLPPNRNWVYLYHAYLCDSGGMNCSEVDPGIIIVP